jgi:recombinational DNA repair ATPase RecF
MSETRHKIIQLTAENIKKLRVVSISVKDGVTVIAGDNAQGKSSLLDALMFLFMGKRHPDPKLLREGTKKGMVEAETDALILKRTLTASGGGSLTIKPKEGQGSYNSPQGFLDDLTKRVCFDPMAFLNLRPAEQAGRLKQLIGLDFDEIEGKIRTTFEKRTEVNREHKGLIAEVEAFEYDASATEEIDPKEIREQLAQIDSKRKDCATAIESLNKKRYGLEKWLGERKSLSEYIGELKQKLEQAEQDYEEAIANSNKIAKEIAEEEKAVNELEKAIPDQSVLLGKLDEIALHNENVRQTKRRAEKAKARDEKRRESDALTRQIESLEEEKREALAGAKFPIEGLAFTAEGVTYNGQPLEQASSAEQLRVSVAISAAMNPEMPVMVLKDGSLLDKKSMRLLCELAKEHDLQVLVERIERDEFVSVVIEDGSIVDTPDAGNSGDNQESFTLEP